MSFSLLKSAARVGTEFELGFPEGLGVSNRKTAGEKSENSRKGMPEYGRFSRRFSRVRILISVWSDFGLRGLVELS